MYQLSNVLGHSLNESYGGIEGYHHYVEGSSYPSTAAAAAAASNRLTPVMISSGDLLEPPPAPHIHRRYGEGGPEEPPPYNEDYMDPLGVCGYGGEVGGGGEGGKYILLPTSWDCSACGVGKVEEGGGGGGGGLEGGPTPSCSTPGCQGSRRPIKRRNTANKKERRRTQSINNAFTELRDCIPNVPSDTKLSKIKTLRLATLYISHLSDILQGDDPSRTPASFTADLSRRMTRGGGGGREDDKGKKDFGEAHSGRPHLRDRRGKGRTGWPQHVWAMELQQ